MQRVRTIWKEKRGRRHVWKVDEVVSGTQKHIMRAIPPSSIRRFFRSPAGNRKEISQGNSEAFHLRRFHVVLYVWK